MVIKGEGNKVYQAHIDTTTFTRFATIRPPEITQAFEISTEKILHIAASRHFQETLTILFVDLGREYQQEKEMRGVQFRVPLSSLRSTTLRSFIFRTGQLAWQVVRDPLFSSFVVFIGLVFRCPQ